ncbi:MAG: sulfatase [Actinomycetia bacterium]|nr:sulfatase [Actinomycetes bacterium]
MNIWSKPDGTTRASRAAGLGRPAPATADPNNSPSDRPNVLVFMVDDMRADELSGPWMHQTRDLIQNAGVTFTNSFSPLPLCGPARASFLTGKYAHNTGIRLNNDPSSAFNRLDDANALPVWLDDAGYNTAFLGKYINGYAPGSATNPGSYVPPGWDHWNASIGGGTYNYRHTILSNNGNGTIDLKGKYQTNAYAKRGSRLVSRLARKNEPFYFNLSFTAPHVGKPHDKKPSALKSPATAPKKRGAYDDIITTPSGVPGEPCNEHLPRAVRSKKPITPKLQRKITEVRRQRAESLSSVDDAIARIMRSLRKSGELDNTYVIFTSDNGYFLGEFRQPIGKKLQYEPSLRTPTIMRGPGIGQGIERERAFTTIDFAPTIADMAGAVVGANVDGKSLLNTATGKPRPWLRPILTDTGAWRNKRHYGVGVLMPGMFYGEYNEPGNPRELFDLGQDPDELHNLIGSARYRGRTREMSTLLDELRMCRGAECRWPLGQTTVRDRPASKKRGT